jgi:ubiquitin carboxyl-terminal hydrolase 5/13
VIRSDDTGPNGSFETVTLFDCLDAFTAEETVDLRCTSCDAQRKFSKRSRFRTMPAELVINARRFELINWVPTKLDIPVEVNDEPIDLSTYLSTGPGDEEEILPEDAATDSGFQVNTDLLSQLLGMGFPQVRCEKALYLTGNSDLEAAMNWLLSHMDDPDVDEPINKKQVSGNAAENTQDPVKVAQLNEMGIGDLRARRALAATGGDIDRAIDWVFSHPDNAAESIDGQQLNTNSEAQGITPGFDATPAMYRLQSIICHKGASVHAG